MMGLTCLMGTTWGLAFLGSGYINYPILYLFCILNSAQGLLSVLSSFSPLKGFQPVYMLIHCSLSTVLFHQLVTPLMVS